MQRQAILLLSLLLVAPEKAPCQQDMNSESLMDQAQNAVAQRTEQLTDEYAKELERLAKVYEQSGDLVAKAAANTELTRVQQTRQIAVSNFKPTSSRCSGTGGGLHKADQGRDNTDLASTRGATPRRDRRAKTET